MKVCDGVYAYPWTNMMENNCNTYVLDGDGLILIDPGLKRYVPDILDAMKNDGLNPKDISTVLNTHSHPDHMDGNSYFDRDKVKLTMHEEAEKFLSQVGGQFFSMFGLEFPDRKADYFTNGGDVELNNLSLKIFHSPGHSPGSICIYWPEKKVLISGDVAFSGSIGRTDFPGGSLAELGKSIERIAPLEIEYLLPGHNEMVQGSDAVKSNFDFIRRAFFS